MCNLYSNQTSKELMQGLFSVAPDNSKIGNAQPLTAIFPKYEAPIVAVGKSGERSLINAHWGFLTPSKSKRTGAWNKPAAWNNARDDKLLTAGLWKGSFANRRCLIPASAYCESTGKKPNTTYHWFRPEGAMAFAFAGIWRYQKEMVGDTPVDSVVYSMVTTSPSQAMSKYHHRMPLILSTDKYDTWLTGSAENAMHCVLPFEDPMELIGEGIGMKSCPPSAIPL